MAAFAPRSSAALQAARDLEWRVRLLLVQEAGVKDPAIVRIEQEADRIVVLYHVETLTGRAGRTAFIEQQGDGPPELTTVAGFCW